MANSNDKSDAKSDATRQPYEKPRLKEFGQVGALTQAGTGGMVEGMMDMGMMAEKKDRP